MDNLIKISVTLAILTVSSGNLPMVLKNVRKYQLLLLKESQASKWPKAMQLKNN